MSPPATDPPLGLTSCDPPAYSDNLTPSQVKRFLADLYMSQGPGQFMKLMPGCFVDSITKWGSQCPPAGKMYTRRGVFNRNQMVDDAGDGEPVTMRSAAYPRHASRAQQGPRTTRNHDDSMVNVVLYAVTLGMVALIVIDTILRFRK